MDDQNNPLDPLAEGNEFVPADGVGNVADSNTVLSLEDINSLTGRKYPDLATARTALKETYSKVGKMGKVEKDLIKTMDELKIKDEALSEIKGIKDELFYSKHPQYEQYRSVIAKMGNTPSEVVSTEEFKKIFTDLTEFEKTKNAKSVLVTNPRIGQAKTKIDEANEQVKSGQYATAKDTAIAAVLEAYEE